MILTHVNTVHTLLNHVIHVNIIHIHSNNTQAYTHTCTINISLKVARQHSQVKSDRICGICTYPSVCHHQVVHFYPIVSTCRLENAHVTLPIIAHKKNLLGSLVSLHVTGHNF